MLIFVPVTDGELYYTYKNTQRLVVRGKERVVAVLKECHDSLGTGGHAGRRRTMEKVLSSYHWSTVKEDVNKWVDECPHCQHHEVLKTVAPALHPIEVKEAWAVLGMDLIGPLPTTAKGRKYILTATDLFTKWVVAKPLRTKTAAEVSHKIVSILLDFGLVEKIITDQGREFVNERSTKYTPYFAQFGRHPRTPGVVNAAAKTDTENAVSVTGWTEEDLEAKAADIAALHTKINQNIKAAQERQKISFAKRKGKHIKSFKITPGDEVLKANKRKEGRKGGRLEANWTGPYVVASITSKGVATLLDVTGAQLKQCVNIQQLKPFIRPTMRGNSKTSLHKINIITYLCSEQQAKLENPVTTLSQLRLLTRAISKDDIQAKDALIIPAWSQQAGKADHYLLCGMWGMAKEEQFRESILKTPMQAIAVTPAVLWPESGHWAAEPLTPSPPSFNCPREERTLGCSAPLTPSFNCPREERTLGCSAPLTPSFNCPREERTLGCSAPLTPSFNCPREERTLGCSAPLTQPGTNMVEYLSKASNSPHVLMLGDEHTFSEAFAIVNGTALEQPSLLGAEDVCFKTYFVFYLVFPKPCTQVWEFIQCLVFDMLGDVSNVVKLMRAQLNVMLE
ncbi:uncharacterized protein V6R79_004953 [Siganus canaliculatus]